MPGFGTWTWSLRLLSVRAQRVRGARRRVISWCLSQSTGAGVHKNFVCASFWAARERGGRLGRRGATPMHGVGRLRGGPARLTNYKKRSSLRAAQGGSTTYEGRRIPPYCVRLYGVFSTRQLSQNVDKSENRFSRRRHIRRRPRLHGVWHGPSGPQPTSTIMCASPGIARATCAPDSHHLQLTAVLVHARRSYFASPHAKAMAMQVSRARRTQWCVGSAAKALARTTLTR